mmetsp:Transcript_13680/g.45638  ORF Transcript_13680/g.45638 Transcript_13680/m.45638 type:complete len:212 (-) Transcript_13680:224-859(-)
MSKSLAEPLSMRRCAAQVRQAMAHRRRAPSRSRAATRRSSANRAAARSAFKASNHARQPSARCLFARRRKTRSRSLSLVRASATKRCQDRQAAASHLPRQSLASTFLLMACARLSRPTASTHLRQARESCAASIWAQTRASMRAAMPNWRDISAHVANAAATRLWSQRPRAFRKRAIRRRTARPRTFGWSKRAASSNGLLSIFAHESRAIV